ncbi:MAG: sensor histidine kinase [Clostridia bacterium]|nr:sensor histidine kinase [Clostridia bacterium]
MKELSLNILDVAENSVKAGAGLIQIIIEETVDMLVLKIIDDGCGMSEDIVGTVIDPFYTTRTTRDVGLGVPLLKLAAEQTGGGFSIESKCESEYPDNHGTRVVARFFKNHIDFTPLGDVVSSVTTLIQGHPDTDFLFSHFFDDNKCVSLDTREIREVLGNVSLNEYEVIKWIEEYLREQYADTKAC